MKDSIRNQQKLTPVLLTVLGLIMIAAGFMLIKTVGEIKGITELLAYLLVAFGCGIFGHSFGSIIEYKAIKKYPELRKNLEIEAKDERNISITNKSKAKAYDVMIFTFGGIFFCLALMNVEIKFILMLCISYLFVIFTAVYYRIKYEKSM